MTKKYRSMQACWTNKLYLSISDLAKLISNCKELSKLFLATTHIGSLQRFLNHVGTKPRNYCVQVNVSRRLIVCRRSNSIKQCGFVDT